MEDEFGTVTRVAPPAFEPFLCQLLLWSKFYLLALSEPLPGGKFGRTVT